MDATAAAPGGPLRAALRATPGLFAAAAGCAAALTLLVLGARSVLDVGGFCATGGPFTIRQECPERVPGVLFGATWGALVLAAVYAAQLRRHRAPNLAWLLWPGLFLPLAWSFLEHGLDPAGGGVAWAWLACAAVFGAFGGAPLVLVTAGLAEGVRARRAAPSRLQTRVEAFRSRVRPPAQEPPPPGRAVVRYLLVLQLAAGAAGVYGGVVVFGLVT